MKWYWWLLIGLAFGAFAAFFIPTFLLKKQGNPDSLEKARAAKAAKAETEKLNEGDKTDTLPN
jgi:phosphotransferase system  glucose/maltose/N-acetylglucosamine-specific IIC component